jgi:hypothetical protein
VAGLFGRAKAKAKTATRRVRRRIARTFRRRGAQAPTRGVLPTVLGINAAAAPFVSSALPNAPIPTKPTVMEAVTYCLTPPSQGGVASGNTVVDGLNALRVGLQTLNAATVNAIPTIVENAGLAIAENWAAKKSGARKATQLTKKWSAL